MSHTFALTLPRRISISEYRSYGSSFTIARFSLPCPSIANRYSLPPGWINGKFQNDFSSRTRPRSCNKSAYSSSIKRDNSKFNTKYLEILSSLPVTKLLTCHRGQVTFSTTPLLCYNEKSYIYIYILISSFIFARTT